MDTALILKQKVDSGEIKDFEKASDYLNKSVIVNDLLSDFDFDVLNLLNRLTEITEIPFAYQLERVKKWTNKLADLSFCGDGFSITGKSDDILSCYNSMITSILIRNHYPDKVKIAKGVEWILNYQNVERGKKSNWAGSRILKYGGCMKNTPCYIGIVKAMITLTDYKKQPDYSVNNTIENKLELGLEYILDHQIYLRKSDGQPITKDIKKLTYPFSYKTNVIEILRLLKDNHLDSDTRCKLAKDYLLTKKQKDGCWKINSSYLPKCWIQFDKTKEPGQWISYEIERLLN
ncbi:hypothetical protein [Sunxiuqinia elliptica]|uniref:Squalene cyclase C-terminal domain-containing protein n=1 Tax=Sunxiuqinia elliptica TaxID=655355 RepID=A0A1I2KKQ9_9BACT|nr:hypothetical protein [Sunxiuqinia elliptica]SFF65701.1 hypothetical protein SAMN05216283_1122 [Sunxiuqinia elliptica]